MKWIILIRLIGFLFLIEKVVKTMKLVKIIHFTHHSPPSKLSYTWAIYYKLNKWAVNLDMQRYTVDNDSSFAVKFEIFSFQSSGVF